MPALPSGGSARALVLALVTTGLSACPAPEPEPLFTLPATLRASDELLAFAGIPGSPQERSLTLRATGHRTVRIRAITLSDDTVFSVDAVAGELDPGEALTLHVRALALMEGDYSAELHIDNTSDNAPDLRVQLTGTFLPPPGCDDDNPCTLDTYDDAGTCIHSPVRTPCDDGDACTVGDTCEAGRCVGVSLTCDDGIDCTVDACDPHLGCTREPAAERCSDDNVCTVDVCDVMMGCRWESADGAACGGINGCLSMDVCWAGQCLSAPVPDGMPCDDGDPLTYSDACARLRCAGKYVRTLAEGTMGPASAITVDDDGIFWAAVNNRGLSRILKATHETGEVWTVEDNVNVRRMATNARHLYFLDGDRHAILRVFKTGGGAGPVVRGTDEDTHFVVDDDTLFWTTGTELRRTSTHTLETTVLGYSDGDITGLAADATTLYWSSRHGSVGWVSRSGGSAGTIGGEIYARHLVVDDTKLYWIGVDGGDWTALRQADKGFAQVSTLFVTGSGVVSLQQDQDALYLSGVDGPIHRVPKNGGPRGWLGTIPPRHNHPFAVHGGDVYHVEASEIRRESVNAVLLRSENAAPDLLDVAPGNDAFYAIQGTVTHEDQRILRIPRDGITPPTSVALVRNTHSLAVDDTHLYWTRQANSAGEENKLYRAKLDGTEVHRVALGRGRPYRTVVLDGTVFWFSWWYDENALLNSWSSATNTSLVQDVGYPWVSDATSRDAWLYWTAWNAANQHVVLTVDATRGTNIEGVALEGAEHPYSVVADATHLYFFTDGHCGIARIPRSGGAAEVIVKSNLSRCGNLRVNDSHLYWLKYSSSSIRVVRANKDGTWRTELLAHGGNASTFFVDNDALTLVNQGSGTFQWRSTHGEPMHTVADDTLLPSSLIVGGGAVYWVNNVVDGRDSILGVDLPDGNVRSCARHLGTPRNLRYDGADLFWLDEQKGTISTVPAAGGEPRILVRQDRGMANLVVQGDKLSWTRWDAIWSANRDGSNLHVVAAPNISLWTATHMEVLDGNYFVLIPDDGIRHVDPNGTARAVGRASRFTIHDYRLYYLSSAIHRRAFGDGVEELVADASTSTTDLVIEGAHLFWGSPECGICMAPLDGSAPTPVSVVDLEGVTPTGLAVTPDFVIWTENGAVRSLRRH
ncbi:MAG: DUF5050 domain-containing protein [Myxococcota bacterium]